MDLLDIGIKRGSLCELIVTTSHEDDSPNAAPMGIRGIDGRSFEMRVHTDTDTYENLMRGRRCALNVIHDPLVFLRCALQGHKSGSSEVESVSFETSEGSGVPYLSEAQAYVEAVLGDADILDMVDPRGSAKVAKTVFRVRDIRVLKPYPVAPNRGFFAGLELAIALTRGLQGKVDDLLAIMSKTLCEEDFREVERFVNDYLSAKS